MSEQTVIVIVLSVLGSAVSVAIPLASLLWKAFALIADLRLQIVQNRNEIENLADRYDGISRQTIERINHVSGRVKGEIVQLNSQVREMQNFLAKSTDFEIRSQ